MDNFECLTLQNISKMDINQDFAQKYLEHLVHMIQLNKPIDFVQAALVMQTLSSVFAKKVDSLQEQIHAFTIMFRKLELGNNVEEENGENGDGQDRGRSQKAKRTNKIAISQEFENICTPNSIRKSFIRNWSAKDIKTVDPYSIRNKLNECPKIVSTGTTSCYIYDIKMDKLGRKEEFGVNGILCNDLIPKDNFCLPCSHVPDFQKCNETMNASFFPMEPPPPPEMDDAMDVDPLPSPDNDSNLHHYNDVVEEFLNTTENSADHVYFERMNQVQENLVDVDGVFDIMWTPVRDDNKMLEREVRKRNVLKYPDEVLKNKEDRRRYRAPNPTEYILSDMLLATFKIKSNVPLHPHFMHGLAEEHEHRLQEQKNRKPKRTKAKIMTDVGHADDGFRGFGVVADDEVDDHAFEHALDIDVPDIGDAAEGVDEGPMQEAFQQIRDFQQGLTQNQNDESINDIAASVSAWHDKIRPHLEREETRTNFDIHEYGTKILEKFPQTNAKTTIDFEDVVRGQPREEIPRYFLSSLLMANTMNIEISNEAQDELECDMKLTVLSRVRHHEELDEGLRKDLS